MGEAEILQLAEALAALQELKIKLAALEELPLHRCAATPFSSLPAACLYPALSMANFQREKTLFPDVPGTLEALAESQSLLSVHCDWLPIQKNARSAYRTSRNPIARYAGFSLCISISAEVRCSNRYC